MDVPNINKIKIKVDRDLAEIMPDYLKRREANVQEIFSAVKARDFDRIEVIGHQMKGSGAGYGMDEITEIGGAIENEAVAKNAVKLLALAARLADYLKRIEITFE